MKTFVLTLAALAVVGFGAPASASTIFGHLNVANCGGGGGGVTVSAALIDWTLPVGGGDGCLALGTADATLGPVPLLGTIQDLTPSPGSTPGFIQLGALNFTLDGFGPGSTNFNCAGLGVGQSCSVAPGSPFVLVSAGGGHTTVFLAAHGTVTDATGPASNWQGVFSTNLTAPGQSPENVQATIIGGGSVHSTFSADIDVVTVPEPVTLALIGAGLIALAMMRRRTSRA